MCSIQTILMWFRFSGLYFSLQNLVTHPMQPGAEKSTVTSCEYYSLLRESFSNLFSCSIRYEVKNSFGLLDIGSFVVFWRIRNDTLFNRAKWTTWMEFFMYNMLLPEMYAIWKSNPPPLAVACEDAKQTTMALQINKKKNPLYWKHKDSGKDFYVKLHMKGKTILNIQYYKDWINE